MIALDFNNLPPKFWVGACQCRWGRAGDDAARLGSLASFMARAIEAGAVGTIDVVAFHQQPWVGYCAVATLAVDVGAYSRWRAEQDEALSASSARVDVDLPKVWRSGDDGCPAPAWAAPLHGIPEVDHVEYEVGDGWVRASVDLNRDLEVTCVEEGGQTRMYFSTYAHGQHYAGVVEHPDGVNVLARFFRTGELDLEHIALGEPGVVGRG